MIDMQLRQIGVVRSEFTERRRVPRLGGRAAVELFPEYASGLHRLEKHSHLWVIVWLDRAERDILRVIPRGITERRPENEHGVFAVRSPVRPNPIGLTLARVMRIEGARIELDRLDFMDATPVIDLKPYFLSRDAVFAAANRQIGKPADEDALRESLALQAVNYCGGVSRELELAVEIFTGFRAGVLEMVEPRGLRVTVPLNRPLLVDAFIGMTRVRLGAGTLRFGRDNEVCLEYEGGAVVYDLLDDGYRRRSG